jgi:hypothetical protein
MVRRSTQKQQRVISDEVMFRKISLGNWVSCVAIAAIKQSRATKARLLRKTSRYPRVQNATQVGGFADIADTVQRSFW